MTWNVWIIITQIRNLTSSLHIRLTSKQNFSPLNGNFSLFIVSSHPASNGVFLHIKKLLETVVVTEESVQR